jgi:hypothetical protein
MSTTNAIASAWERILRREAKCGCYRAIVPSLWRGNDKDYRYTQEGNNFFRTFSELK